MKSFISVNPHNANDFYISVKGDEECADELDDFLTERCDLSYCYEFIDSPSNRRVETKFFLQGNDCNIEEVKTYINQFISDNPYADWEEGFK